MRADGGNIALSPREQMRSLLLALAFVGLAWLIWFVTSVMSSGVFFERINNTVLELILPFRSNRLRSQKNLLAQDRVARWKDRIVVLTVDDETLQQPQFRKWPIPRQRYAEMLDRLQRGGARAVGIDILFLEPQEAANDAALARALAAHRNVILADDIGSDAKGNDHFRHPLAELIAGWTPSDRQQRLGLTYEAQSESEYVKKVPLVVTLGNERQCAFDILLAARILGVPFEQIRDASEQGLFEGSVFLGKTRVPVVNGAMYVNYFWGGSLASASVTQDPNAAYTDAKSWLNYLPLFALWEMSEQDLAYYFKDRVVLVGVTATAGHDVKTTPLGRMAGVDIHANVILSLLSGEFLHPVSPLAMLLLLLVIGVGTGVIIPRFSTTFSTALTILALIGLYLPLPYLALVKGRLFEPALPMLAMLLAYVSTTTSRIWIEQRARQRYSDLIKKVAPMPDRFIEEFVTSNRTELALGGQKMHLTILFSDIRGYTTLSEQLDDTEVFATLNKLYTEMGHILHKHGGAIFDYLGDAQMVVFGMDGQHPRHADDALQAGLQMVEHLKALNEQWTREQKPPLEIGVGICTGDVTIGLMGSSQRQQYAAIGDTTNVSARLQALSGPLGCPVIISESTFERLADRYVMEQVQDVKLKGKANAMTVYKVTAREVSEEKMESR